MADNPDIVIEVIKALPQSSSVMLQAEEQTT